MHIDIVLGEEPVLTALHHFSPLQWHRGWPRSTSAWCIGSFHTVTAHWYGYVDEKESHYRRGHGTLNHSLASVVRSDLHIPIYKS